MKKIFLTIALIYSGLCFSQSRRDTTRVVMLLCDTATFNSWVQPGIMVSFTSHYFNTIRDPYVYFEWFTEDRKSLPKNIIVLITKQL